MPEVYRPWNIEAALALIAATLVGLLCAILPAVFTMSLYWSITEEILGRSIANTLLPNILLWTLYAGYTALIAQWLYRQTKIPAE